MTPRKEHRYSGWPGAYCLDCGQDDPWELAIVTGAYDPYNDTWRSEEVRSDWEWRINNPCHLPENDELFRKKE